MEIILRDKDVAISHKDQELAITTAELRKSEESIQTMILKTERELFRDKQQIEVLREKLNVTEGIKQQLEKKCQLLLAEIEDLKDSCEAIKIRCRKFENKKMFNHLIRDISAQQAED